MSAPVAAPPRGGVHASAVTTPVEGRRPAPWLTIAAVIAVFGTVLLPLLGLAAALGCGYAVLTLYDYRLTTWAGGEA